MSIEEVTALPYLDTGPTCTGRRATAHATSPGTSSRSRPAAGGADGAGRWHEHGNPLVGNVVAAVGLSPAARAVVRAGVSDPRVVARYWAKVAYADRDQCWHFTGAIHPHGHGRFFVGQYTDTGGARRGVVVIAHRLGWALTYGPGSLNQVPVLAHDCDEAGCQNPAHLAPATRASNHHDWDTRHWQLGSPLRDTRGAAGRARAIRTAILTGQDVAAARAAGMSSLDRDQLLLW